MKECYTLVGVINLFELYPDFLFPVYEKGNEYFFHNGANDQIESFDRVKDVIKEKIIFFDDTDYPIINVCKKRHYHEKGTPAYAFQDENKVIFCADLEVMLAYIKNYRTEDVYVKEDIYEFFSENILLGLSRKINNSSEEQGTGGTLDGEKLQWDFPYSTDILSAMIKRNPSAEFYQGHLLKRKSYFSDQEGIWKTNVAWNDSNIMKGQGLEIYFNQLLQQCLVGSEPYKACIDCLYAVVHQDWSRLSILLTEYRSLFSEIFITEE